MCSCPLLTLSQLLVAWLCVTDDYVTVFQEWVLVAGWQNRIIDMDLHGGLLHNSAPCCPAVAVITRSLPSLLVYSHISRLLHLLAPWPHGVFVWCPELSAKHFAEFPFLLCCSPLFRGLSQLCEVSYFFGCSFPEREQLLYREARNRSETSQKLKWVVRSSSIRWVRFRGRWAV